MNKIITRSFNYKPLGFRSEYSSESCRSKDNRSDHRLKEASGKTDDFQKPSLLNKSADK